MIKFFLYPALIQQQTNFTRSHFYFSLFSLINSLINNRSECYSITYLHMQIHPFVFSTRAFSLSLSLFLFLFLSLHTDPTPYLQRQLLCWWIMVNNLTSDRSTPCPVARHMHLRQTLQSAESAGAIAIDFFWNSAVKDDHCLSLSFCGGILFYDHRDITIDRRKKVRQVPWSFVIITGYRIACNFTTGSFVRSFIRG